MYDRAPRKIPDTLQELLDAVSQATGIDYNFVLMNFYQDGTHSISYHSDDEKFLGEPCKYPGPCFVAPPANIAVLGQACNCRVQTKLRGCPLHSYSALLSRKQDAHQFLWTTGLNPTIASLSLGGSRDFLMKHKDDAKKKEKYPLENGDMLVMQGTTQSKWLHSIPKRTSSVQPRVNITFRKAMNAAGTNNYYKYNVGDGGVYRMVKGQMQLASTVSV